MKLQVAGGDSSYLLKKISSLEPDERIEISRSSTQARHRHRHSESWMDKIADVGFHFFQLCLSQPTPHVVNHYNYSLLLCP